MTDEMPISGGLDPKKAEPVDVVAQASEAFKGAADNIAAAVQAGKRPGMPLDILARLTREAPLASLFVAFLVGVAVARQR